MSLCFVREPLMRRRRPAPRRRGSPRPSPRSPRCGRAGCRPARCSRACRPSGRSRARASSRGSPRSRALDAVGRQAGEVRRRVARFGSHAVHVGAVCRGRRPGKPLGSLRNVFPASGSPTRSGRRSPAALRLPSAPFAAVGVREHAEGRVHDDLRDARQQRVQHLAEDAQPRGDAHRLVDDRLRRSGRPPPRATASARCW